VAGETPALPVAGETPALPVAGAPGGCPGEWDARDSDGLGVVVREGEALDVFRWGRERFLDEARAVAGFDTVAPSSSTPVPPARRCATSRGSPACSGAATRRWSSGSPALIIVPASRSRAVRSQGFQP
jgi:hypothetical protein